jgi:hypothetical protein
MNNPKVDNQKASISELAFNTYPQGLKDWIIELGWKREDIISCHVEYEMVETNASDEKWKRWKYGNRVDVTVNNMQLKRHFARFIRLDNGQWQKESEADITQFNNTLAQNPRKVPIETYDPS